MKIKDLLERAKEIRSLYEKYEEKKYGRSWTREEIAQGMATDFGDFMKLVMAKSGVRSVNDLDQKIEHELSDLLWSVLVLSDKYNVDIEQAFYRTMDEIEVSIQSKI